MNGKSNSNVLKTRFVKLNNNNPKSFGHSNMSNNNFSRCNSVATADSSTSTQTTPEIKTTKHNRMHSQDSWSMSHSKSKKINKFFTEQRSNYERVAEQQLQQQELWTWSSEQSTRCRDSNSRTTTCSVDKNHNEKDTKTTKFCNSIYSKFMALSEFRLQNRKDCFADHQHRLLYLQAETPPNQIKKTSGKAKNTFQMSFHKFNKCLVDTDNNKNPSSSTASSFSPFSPASVSPTPYALRQRILRDQLAKDSTKRKSITLNTDKSVALSHLAKY